jgi:hypothetical protein
VPKHWRERAFDSPREELLEQWARCSDAINRWESLDEIYAAPSVAADLTPFFTPSIFFYRFPSPSVSRRFGERKLRGPGLRNHALDREGGPRKGVVFARVERPWRCTGPIGLDDPRSETADAAPVDRRFFIWESGCGTGPFVTVALNRGERMWCRSIRGKRFSIGPLITLPALPGGVGNIP